MHPLALAALCVALYVITAVVLKFVGKTVPIVLIGLPVCLAGLSAITAIALATAAGITGTAPAWIALIALVGGGVHGWRMAKNCLNEALRDTRF